MADLGAGVTVGLVALPLAMAFAISSGVAPQAGLYCAIVTGFVISAFGGSKTQIGGPTGAFVVVVAGIISKYGIDGLFACTMMAGVMLVLLGITGMGTAVKYFPRPVIVGFTNGIAILIASTQIMDFFGLQLDQVPGDFFHRMAALAHAFPTMNWVATLLAAISLAVMISCQKYARRVPGTILVCFGATAAVALIHLGVETIGTRFGGIPKGLPHFVVPQLHYDMVRQLFSPALTVAMLGAIESLMSAVVSDKMSNDKHNPNVELMAQGVANILSPLVGGLPATGAIARTATNVRAGAKTPVAGMIHSLTLLVIILLAAPLVKDVPLAALAAILLMVAYNMGDWEEIPQNFEVVEGRHRNLAADADVDGSDRSDVCRGIWNDSCRADVHPQSFADDHGNTRDARLRGGQQRACSAGQRHSGLRGGVSRARPVSVWRDGQVRRHS